jgi:hypothetical protein
MAFTSFRSTNIYPEYFISLKYDTSEIALACPIGEGRTIFFYSIERKPKSEISYIQLQL